MATAQVHNVLRHIRRMVVREPGSGADSELLQRFVAGGEEAAFEELLGRHGPMVYTLCQRLLHHAQDAEDVFQATFLMLARKAASIRRRESVGAWLYGVAYRLSLRTQVAAARRSRHERRAAERPAEGPLAGLSLREARAVLDDELARLPDKFRAPLVLCYLEGATRDEAARQLGWSAALVKSRLGQARDLLRRRLSRRGLTLPSALAATLLLEGVMPAAPPDALVRATALAARSSAAGGAVSSQVARLVEGGLKVTANVYRTGLALVLVGLMTGAGLLAYRALAAPVPPPTQTPPAAPADGPRAERPARADNFGDPLPPGALARLGTVRFRTGLPTTHVAFSPDGKIVATASPNSEVDNNLGGVSLWDRATGKRLRQFAAWKEPPLDLAFSPDGRTLATQEWGGGVGTSAPIRLWDVATGAEVRRITAGDVALDRTSGNGRLLGVGIVFSLDGKALAARGPDRAIHLWETATGKDLLKLKADPEDSSPLAFAPGGKILATSADKMIRLWDTRTGAEIARLTGHKDTARLPSFSADGKTLTALAGAPGDPFRMKAYVWDVATGRLRHTWELPPEPAAVGCLSPDGKAILIGGRDGMRLLDLATGKQIRRLPAPSAAHLFCAAFSPDGKAIAVVGDSRVLQLLDAATGAPLSSFTGHQGVVQYLALSPDGKRVASVASDPGIWLWDVAAARRLDCFRTLKVDPQDRWSARAARMLAPLGAFPSFQVDFRGIAFSPDGRMLAAAARDPVVRLLNAKTGEEVRQLVGSGSGHAAVAFSREGKALAAGSWDGSIRVWEPATGKRLWLWEPPAAALRRWGVICLAFSPDGRLLATGGWGESARLWDARSGQLYCELPGHKTGVSSVAFSPDGRTLATSHWDRTIRLWEVLTGKERGRLLGHTDRVTELAFSPDGRLASGSHDRTVRIWDLGRGAEAGRFVGHESVVGPLAFSSDGKLLVSAGWDTTMLVWDMQWLPRPPRAEAPDLSPKKRDQLWADLADGDTMKAYRAVRTLARSADQAVPFLKQRLPPARAADPEAVARLIADLDSARFEARAKAEAELEKLEELAEPALRRAAEKKPSSLELRRRLDGLLKRLRGPITSPERLRELRSVEVLEHAGTPEAQQVLRTLGAGVPTARLTREAQAALDHLARR